MVGTARADLVALEPAILALIERDDVAAVERELSVRVPAGWTRSCAVSITPNNMPSLALARALGFEHVGERIDDIDGRELVLERPLPIDTAISEGGDRDHSPHRTDSHRGPGATA